MPGKRLPEGSPGGRRHRQADRRPIHARPKRVLALLVAASLVLSCGCAERGWNTVAWFPVQPPTAAEPPAEVKQAAPESGEYKVKFANRPDATDREFHTYGGGARRVLRRGDPLGFFRGVDGTIFAIAGAETFPLGRRRNRSGQPQYLAWAYRPAVKNADVAGDTFKDVGKTVLAGCVIVGVVAVTGLAVWYGLTHNDDD